ncbi:unnamed protein product, partial [Porites lobata]
FSLFLGCGAVVNNTLKSPGYPHTVYPNNMNCLYLVAIPHGMAMRVSFEDFYVEYESTCDFDSLEIINNKNQKYGIYCGLEIGRKVTVTGEYVLLIFRSDSIDSKRGFWLFFHAVPVDNSTTSEPPSNGCGAVVNNSLKSPGFPNKYPSRMDCIYLVPIPKDMTMKVIFEKFSMEYTDKDCSFDFLKITNENNEVPGLHCGQKNGHVVLVTGEVVLMTFHSDAHYEREGFLLQFTPVPHVPPKVVLPAPVVTALPGFKLRCKATGSPLISIALLRNNTVLVNTTNSEAIITLDRQGNYSCVASSKYGFDKKEFPVIFTDCNPSSCSHQYHVLLGNSFNCLNAMFPMDTIRCAPTVVEKIGLHGSDVPQPSAEIFSNFPNLQFLILSSNAISYLPEGIFAPLTNVYRLEMSSNAIKVLPQGIFASLSGLSQLNLTSNNIKNLTAETFSTLINLQNLYVGSNRIQSITTNVISHLTLLSSLWLSSNNIQRLPSKLFASNRNLVRLDISYNNISRLPKDVFCCLGSLKYL